MEEFRFGGQHVEEGSPWVSAAKWAGVTFIAAAVLCAAMTTFCVKVACFSHQPWTGDVWTIVIALSLPGLIAFDSLRQPAPPLSLHAAIVLGISFGASASVLVLFLRVWYLRFRRFLAVPLPSDWQPDPRDAMKIGAPLPRGPMIFVFLFVTAVFLLVQLMKNGFDGSSFQRVFPVLFFVALVSLIPFYFELRRARAPDKLEAVLAFAWLMIRRGLLGMVTFLVGIGFMSYAWNKGSGWITLGGLFVTALLGWWAWVGPGNSRAFDDDLAMHRVRKKRYGWR